MDMMQLKGSTDMSKLLELVKDSDRLHDSLWSLAESAMEDSVNSQSTGIFSQSVLAMINAQDARLQAVLFNRISPVIWFTTFSVVMALVMDLDRPNQSLFSMNQQLMVDLHNRMAADGN
jgi:hypothetical protein